jgi:hypothetical protein
MDNPSKAGRKRKPGRKRGQKTRGYWCRKTRRPTGWFLSGGYEKLVDPDTGKHVRDLSLAHGCPTLEKLTPPGSSPKNKTSPPASPQG